MTTRQPEFGLLSGHRVVMIGLSVAAPFAGAMFAEHGAEVIWIENPRTIDSSRVARRSGAWQQDRRNMHSLSMDYVKGPGREVFAELLKTTDVLVEASVGGRFAKIGWSDEVLWEINPRLVITHISGFGQTGDPAYVSRASFDPIAQAFGCAMRMNGLPGQPSTPAMPFPADYSAGMFAFGMANAALVKRMQTGRGESIDIAQFEVMMRLQANYPTDFYRYGLDYVKEGTRSRICAMYGTYTAADGEELYVLVLGGGVMAKAVQLLGLEYPSELFPDGAMFVPVDTEAAEVLESAFADYLSRHTAAEVEENFASAGIPCSRIMDYEAARSHPHYQARQVITEWLAADQRTLIPGVKVVPEVAGHPGQIWRGAPNVGQDNDAILGELGIPDQTREAMYEAGQLSKRDYFETTGD